MPVSELKSDISKHRRNEIKTKLKRIVLPSDEVYFQSIESVQNALCLIACPQITNLFVYKTNSVVHKHREAKNLQWCAFLS